MLLKYVLLCDYIVLFLNFVITIIGKSKKMKDISTKHKIFTSVSEMAIYSVDFNV